MGKVAYMWCMQHVWNMNQLRLVHMYPKWTGKNLEQGNASKLYNIWVTYYKHCVIVGKVWNDHGGYIIHFISVISGLYCPPVCNFPILVIITSFRFIPWPVMTLYEHRGRTIYPRTYGPITPANELACRQPCHEWEAKRKGCHS